MNANKHGQFAAMALVLGLAGCGGSGGGGNPPPAPSNTAPAISGIADITVDQDTVMSVAFSVDDRETPGSLKVSALADGNALIPEDGVTLSGGPRDYTLTLAPLEATTGSAAIRVRVVDMDGAAATRDFRVSVNARNASMRGMAFDTLAKSESDEPTVINGLSVQNDVDDPAAFEALMPPGEE
jgi:hypothetical protein